MVPLMTAESSATSFVVTDAKPQTGSANRKASAARLTVEGMSFVLLVLGRLRRNYARSGKTGNPAPQLALSPPIRRLDDSSFLDDLLWILVVAQPSVFWMAKVIRVSPLRKIDSDHRFRFEPDALLHFFGGQTLAPASRFFLRQVSKGAFGDL
jgi:hypothetical protein